MSSCHQKKKCPQAIRMLPLEWVVLSAKKIKEDEEPQSSAINHGQFETSSCKVKGHLQCQDTLHQLFPYIPDGIWWPMSCSQLSPGKSVMKNLELEHVQFFFVQQNTADHPVIPIMAASSGAAGFRDWMAMAGVSWDPKESWNPNSKQLSNQLIGTDCLTPDIWLPRTIFPLFNTFNEQCLKKACWLQGRLPVHWSNQITQMSRGKNSWLRSPGTMIALKKSVRWPFQCFTWTAEIWQIAGLTQRDFGKQRQTVWSPGQTFWAPRPPTFLPDEPLRSCHLVYLLFESRIALGTSTRPTRCGSFMNSEYLGGQGEPTSRDTQGVVKCIPKRQSLAGKMMENDDWPANLRAPYSDESDLCLWHFVTFCDCFCPAKEKIHHWLTRPRYAGPFMELTESPQVPLGGFETWVVEPAIKNLRLYCTHSKHAEKNVTDPLGLSRVDPWFLEMRGDLVKH